jgi:hypothetical protein
MGALTFAQNDPTSLVNDRLRLSGFDQQKE